MSQGPSEYKTKTGVGRGLAGNAINPVNPLVGLVAAGTTKKKLSYFEQYASTKGAISTYDIITVTSRHVESIALLHRKM